MRFLTFLAYSIVLELALWVFIGGGTVDPPPYPYVANYFLWTGKHLLLTTVTVIVFKHLPEFKSKKQLVQLFFDKMIFGTAALYMFLMSVGHTGSFTCGLRCSDIEGLAYVITIPTIMIVTIVTSSALFLAQKKIENKERSATSVFVSIVSAIIIIIAAYQPIFLKSIGEFPFTESQISFSFAGLEPVFREKTKPYSSDNWFKKCKQLSISSAGLSVLGSRYVESCYHIGAIIFEKPENCSYLRRELKEICEREIITATTVQNKGVTDAKSKNVLSDLPKFRAWINLYHARVSNPTPPPYAPTLEILNETIVPLHLTGASIYLNSIKLLDLDDISVPPRETKHIPLSLSFEKVACAFAAQKTDRYNAKLMQGNNILDQTNQVGMYFFEWKDYYSCFDKK